MSYENESVCILSVKFSFVAAFAQNWDKSSSCDSTQEVPSQSSRRPQSFTIPVQIPEALSATMERYERLRELGRGSYGCAILVRDRNSRQQRAALSPSFSTSFCRFHYCASETNTNTHTNIGILVKISVKSNKSFYRHL